MNNTAVVTDGETVIVAEEGARFSWGITIAGAVAAIATTSFLVALGAGVGLALAPSTTSGTVAFLTLGGIYFFASQAFGFAVGGYLVGRLLGPEVETTKEEEFRAAAHGFSMWAVAVVAGLVLVGLSATFAGSTVAAGAASRPETIAGQSYWVDDMFRPAKFSPQLASDKAEAGRILAMNAGMLSPSDADRIARLIAQDAGISVQAGLNRVRNTQNDLRIAVDQARKAASVVSLWTAFALLFGCIVSVAAAISARWLDDRITFSLARRGVKR